MADSDAKLREITEKLQSLAECAICLEPLKIPFEVCSTGHMMCSDCVQVLNRCPTCQAEFSLRNPVALKNLLEALPRFCKYNLEYGCRDVLQARDRHEAFCQYRKIPCQRCQTLLHVRDLKDHCKTQHSESRAAGTDYKMRWTALDNDYEGVKFYATHMSNDFFYIKLDIRPHLNYYMKISFFTIPIGQPVNDFFLRVEFQNGDFKHTSTIKAYVVSEENDLKNEDNLETYDSEFSMVVSKCLIGKIKQGNTLDWVFKVFKCKK